jgi:hypothetical protein
MTASNLAEYNDGSYSATKIECAVWEGDTYSKFMSDLEGGKIRHIGELTCFDSKGEMKILKNLRSKEFENN